MFKSAARVVTRLLLAFALAGALLSVLAVPVTHAARSICRSDPIVKLSNGQEITIWSEIYDVEIADIESIDYYLHAPRGLDVVEVIHPFPETAHLENFYFYDDQLLLSYVTGVKVNLKDKNRAPVTVRAYTDVKLLRTQLGASLWRTGDSRREVKMTVLLP